MNLAGQVSEPPRSSSKEIENAFRNKTNHQQQIRCSQIHNQHVGWSPKIGIAAKDSQNTYVPKNSRRTYFIIFIRKQNAIQQNMLFDHNTKLKLDLP